MRAAPDRGERFSSGRESRETERKQDDDEAEMRHDAVPNRRAPNRRTLSMFGRDEHERGHRHELPQHQERGHAPRRGYEYQRRREQREHALHRSARQVVVAVSDRVDGRRDDHDRGREHEPCTQRIEIDVYPAEWQHVAPTSCHGLAGRQHAYRSSAGRRARAHGARARDDDPSPSREQEPGRAAGDRSTSRDRERGRCETQRPVKRRSSATIVSGSGGQPRISASTGTTSRTAPATP